MMKKGWRIERGHSGKVGLKRPRRPFGTETVTGGVSRDVLKLLNEQQAVIVRNDTAINELMAQVSELAGKVACLENENSRLREKSKSRVRTSERTERVPAVKKPSDARISPYSKGNLSEEGIRNWADREIPHPETGVRITGKRFLRSAFFGNGSFWKQLQAYAESIPQEITLEMGGKVPSDKSSYALKLRKAGFSECSPRNVCLWIGALSEEEARWCDKDGFLSPQWLRRWCHEGYVEPSTGERILGNDLFIAFSEEPNFWKALGAYVDAMTTERIEAIGGKMPRYPESFAHRLSMDKKTASRTEIFELLQVRDDGTECVPAIGQRFLSAEGLVRWYREGYDDPKTGKRVTGRKIFQRLLPDPSTGRKKIKGKSFWDRLVTYAESLDGETVAAMGWRLPPHPRSLAKRLKSPDAGSVSIEELFAALEGPKEEPVFESPEETVVAALSETLPAESETTGMRMDRKTRKPSTHEARRALNARKLEADVKSKVLRAIREMASLCEEEGGGSVRGDFSYLGDGETITVTCQNSQTLSRLANMRPYVEENLLSKITEETGVSVSFDWEGA